MNVVIQNAFNTFRRFVNGLAGPSQKRNLAALRKRGETPDSLTIREATSSDLPSLAALHVKTWIETYGKSGAPTLAAREQQWREVFNKPGYWFVLVVENTSHELVGFAYGKSYDHGDLPQYSGELNKIYLLRQYQRMGLGKKLLREVARKFLSMGVTSMVLFGIPQNASSGFHEAMGGKRLNAKDEVFQGGYSWSDLNRLI